MILHQCILFDLCKSGISAQIWTHAHTHTCIHPSFYLLVTSKCATCSSNLLRLSHVSCPHWRDLRCGILMLVMVCGARYFAFFQLSSSPVLHLCSHHCVGFLCCDPTFLPPSPSFLFLTSMDHRPNHQHHSTPIIILSSPYLHHHRQLTKCAWRAWRDRRRHEWAPRALLVLWSGVCLRGVLFSGGVFCSPPVVWCVLVLVFHVFVIVFWLRCFSFHNSLHHSPGFSLVLFASTLIILFIPSWMRPESFIGESTLHFVFFTN